MCAFVLQVVDQVNQELLPRSSYCHVRRAYGAAHTQPLPSTAAALDTSRSKHPSSVLVGVGRTTVNATVNAVDRLAAKFKRCA